MPQFQELTLNPTEDDELTALLVDEGILRDSQRVLDIGCASGRYTFRLSNLCGEAVGIDYTPDMIAAACAEAKKYPDLNCRFELQDWENLSLKDRGWEDAFDVVFANRVPGIHNGVTLQKMIDASRKWCVLGISVERAQKIEDEVARLCGIVQPLQVELPQAASALGMLLTLGYRPRVGYTTIRKERRMEKEEALCYYQSALLRTVKRMKQELKYGDNTKEILEKLLLPYECEGTYTEVTSLTTAILYWRV